MVVGPPYLHYLRAQVGVAGGAVCSLSLACIEYDKMVKIEHGHHGCAVSGEAKSTHECANKC